MQGLDEEDICSDILLWRWRVVAPKGVAAKAKWSALQRVLCPVGQVFGNMKEVKTK